MYKIIGADEPFERLEMAIDEAVQWAQQSEQPYKVELLNDLKRAGTTIAKDLDSQELGLEAVEDSKVERVSFYRNGDFTDLCRGPHVESTGKVGAFKLMRVSGAYWRGKETNPQMQRIYGVAFETKEDLKKYLEMLEEANKRDHRKLGQELDLFIFSDMVGSGLPLFTPRGTVLRDELATFSNSLRQRYGFEKVWTPHMTKKDLYEASGHWAKFGDELFLVKSQETSDELVLKPMSCPHHTRIYAAQPRSYRDLPLRYLETATIYRDEKTGELGGLNRVRAATQDDSHIFCRADQIEAEINNLLMAATELYATVDMPLRVRLSYRDETDAYLGRTELWENAQKQLKNAVIANKLDYFEQEGEAAFYGPKIDFMATDAIGREHQVATIQLDFVQPKRFGLDYIGEDGGKQQPVMIHCALLGSIERFLSVYIEHTAGKFPVWLAPEQIRFITVNQEDSTVSFAEKIRDQAKELGLRLTIDNSNESVGKKIRAAELMKVPYTVVIGDKEISSSEVTPRIRKDLTVQPDERTIGIQEFLKTVTHEANSRVIISSL
jgi:threonyl-tRNA synthetase